MKCAELEQHINAAADYLKEKKARDEHLDGWEMLAPGQSRPLRNETRDRLKDALKKAEALESELYPLMLSAHDLPFLGMTKLILEAYSGANQATTCCRLALEERLPGQRRGMPYHKSAVRLAASFFQSPKRKETLEAARKIIVAAGLSDDYTTEAAHKWWKEIRDEYDKQG
ncbi:hypothetical protein [Marinobacter sp. SS5-14b]|uniref:hypothetical protein n=1 Tax=Marinobacter sp. SS5-14b TaxID=3050456 RepID=UPI0026DF4E27|nr:hypothetical protein [Marinobacter sp. SS5-14b]